MEQLLRLPGQTAASRRQIVAVNGRFRVHRSTGLQRYADEVVRRLADRLSVIEPRLKLKGLSGHMWEQAALPLRAYGRLLWSPCNTGPVFHPRQVVTVHDLFPMEHPEWFSSAFARAFNLILPRLARSARAIIAVSEHTRSRLIELLGVQEAKVSVIYSGIGPSFRRVGQNQRESDLRAIALPSNNYFLSVSSLEPRKNIDRILDAWLRALPNLRQDCWLVVAGAVGSRSVFHALSRCRAPDRVLFPGYVPEALLPALYSGARGFLFPSLAEGFGFPVLEAMACGTPVITSDCSSLAEISGGAALSVDPYNITQIAHGIVRLATDHALHSHLAAKGLINSRRFRWDNCAERTWSVLEAALQ